MTQIDYEARIEYDEDDRIFGGRIAGIRDRIGCDADSMDGLSYAIHEPVEDYPETCARIGKESKKTCSPRGSWSVSVRKRTARVRWRLILAATERWDDDDI